MDLRRLLSSRGFTLIELLVVILVIAVLIAVAAPSFLGQTEKAEDSTAKQDLAVAYKAAKASTITEQNQGQYGSAAFVAAAINASEPHLNALSGADYPSTVNTSGKRNIAVEVSSGVLRLRALSKEGRGCVIQIPANAAPSAPVCQAVSGSSPSTPVALTSTAPDYIGSDQPTLSPLGDKIAYIVYDNVFGQRLHVMNSDGSGDVLITAGVGSESGYQPVWSPDGSKIAFLRSMPVPPAGTYPQLFVVDAAGTNEIPLTSNAKGLNGAHWAPDGLSIYVSYYEDPPDVTNDIFRIVVATQVATRLTNVTQNLGSAMLSPRVSSTGQVLYRDMSDDRLYTMTASGGSPTAVTPLGVLVNRPGAWSPAGDKIAFFAQDQPGLGQQELRIVDANGSNAQTLVSPLTNQAEGVIFSGSSIYWSEGDAGIKSVPAAGGPVSVIYDGPGATWIYGLDVSADGSRLVFVSDEDTLNGTIYSLALP